MEENLCVFFTLFLFLFILPLFVLDYLRCGREDFSVKYIYLQLDRPPTQTHTHLPP